MQLHSFIPRLLISFGIGSPLYWQWSSRVVKRARQERAAPGLLIRMHIRASFSWISNLSRFAKETNVMKVEAHWLVSSSSGRERHAKSTTRTLNIEEHHV